MAFLARSVAARPVGGEHLDQLAPLFGRERTDDTNVGQICRRRRTARACSDPTSLCPAPCGARGGLVPAEAADYELGRAFVFDLHHHPLARPRSKSAALATTPSRPAPSKRANQSSATAGPVWPASGGRPRDGPASAEISELFQETPAFVERLVRRSRSPSANRSKATKEAGVFSASSRTLLSAGCTRC